MLTRKLCNNLISDIRSAFFSILFFLFFISFSLVANELALSRNLGLAQVQNAYKAKNPDALQRRVLQHTEEGTNYGDHGIGTYATMKHGPDGALFLDPYFIPYLLNLHDQVILDAGCGAGPWSILAAKNGAIVHGIDIQQGMIEKATQVAREEEVADRIDFIVGDVSNLPYPDNFFDKALSINVGCNLPSLKLHLMELNRVLKGGGIAIITAPSSFGIVFTDGKKSDEQVLSSIDLLLTNHQDSFPKIIQDLDEVYRATFAKKQGRWSLVQNETVLSCGEAIWRKIPMLVVPNYYHPVEEYLALIITSNFCIRQIHQPHFVDVQSWQDYNKNQKNTLGKEYVTHSPFVIFILEKQNDIL